MERKQGVAFMETGRAVNAEVRGQTLIEMRGEDAIANKNVDLAKGIGHQVFPVRASSPTEAVGRSEKLHRASDLSKKGVAL